MAKQLKRGGCRVDERSESTNGLGGFRCAHPPYEWTGTAEGEDFRIVRVIGYSGDSDNDNDNDNDNDCVGFESGLGRVLWNIC